MIGAIPFYLYFSADSVFFSDPRALPVSLDKNDSVACAAFFDCLNKKPRIPLILLIDDASISFSKETLPTLHRLDRQNLLKRRLANTFRDSPLSKALPLKKDTAVLAGLSQESTINEWLSFLEPQIKNPLGSVALMPLELSHQIMNLCPAAKTKWCLFAAMQNKDFLRQTLYECGAPVYTRLTKTPPHQIQEEISATIHYAPRLGLKDANDLSLITILPETASALFEKRPTTIRLSTDYATFLTAWRKDHKIRHPLFSAQTSLTRWDRPLQKIGIFCAALTWLLVLNHGVQRGTKTYESTHENQLLQREIDGFTDSLESEKTSPEAKNIALLREAVVRHRLFTTLHLGIFPIIDALRKATTAPFSSLTWTTQPDGSFIADLEPPLSPEAATSLDSVTVENSETSTRLTGGAP